MESGLLSHGTFSSLIFLKVGAKFTVNYKVHCVTPTDDFSLGTHSFHWYFSQGLPAMLGIMLPLFPLGVFLSKSWRLLILIVVVLLAYSTNPHKEFRFILPALPLTFVYCGYALQWVQNRKPIHLFRNSSYKISPLRLVLPTLLIVNAILIVLFSLVHQRAPISVVNYISKSGDIKDVHFLTGCHSTPFYSHIHRNISLRQLDCSPQYYFIVFFLISPCTDC